MKTRLDSHWRRVFVAPLLLWLAASLAGCTDNRATLTETKNGYVLAVRTDPEPPQVGKTAVVTAVLHYAGRPELADCPIRFRQFMPALKLDGDNQYHAMRKALTSGIYSGESGVFPRGGKWIIEFEITCHDEKTVMQFHFHLAFPK